MKTMPRNSRPLLSQTHNNMTLWVGHLKQDPYDHLAGQTFACTSDGKLNNIQVYSSAVTKAGELELSIHEFDHHAQTWGPSLAESRLNVAKDDELHWLSFNLDAVELIKGREYAFRLSTENGLFGIGEAVSNAHHPFLFGQAWSSHAAESPGSFYKYFSLAFKVELCA
ncbi:MAG: hypothetical protein NTW29_01960 [Bacteroidetes bacterium]|nr:hypothetical protein [Bacteroidota bacterium]